MRAVLLTALLAGNAAAMDMAAFGTSLKSELSMIQLEADNCRMSNAAGCEAKVEERLEKNLKWAVPASKSSPGLVEAIKAWDLAVRSFLHDGKPKAAIASARNRVEQELALAN